MWVPEKARESMERHHREVLESAITAEAWTRELQKIDPCLSLVKAHDNAHAVGLLPGFWHVMRHVDHDVTSLLPVVGDDGEFVEPTSKLIEMVKAGDLQNEGAMRARRERDERRAAEKERERERERAERRDELAERLASATGVSVSMSRRAA